MRSMTAYGRHCQSLPSGRWIVEIHSVNRKQLDLSVYMPKDFLVFDIDIRKMLSSAVSRGQVTVKVFFTEQLDSHISFEQKLTRLQRAKSFYEKLAIALQSDSSCIQNLPFLLEHEVAFNAAAEEKNEAILRNELFGVFDQALSQFLRMKEVEGAALRSQMENALETFSEFLVQLKNKAPDQLENYKERLGEKIKQLMHVDPTADDRYLKEIMLYAEKVDISEEVARLMSHTAQLATLFASKDKTLGKNIDFLLQETNREVNTICSKSESLEVSYLALQMRAELEKIREQVQNIE